MFDGSLTPEQKAGMLAKIRDRQWRLRNFYWIVDENGTPMRFAPNPVQDRLDTSLHNRNLVLKSRQHGITTWACVRGLDSIVMRPDCQVGIVAHKREDAEKFFRKKVLYAYDRLPEAIRRIRPAARRDLKDGILEIVHTNPGGGGDIQSIASTSAIEVSLSHRGGTLQFLHVSEYGPMCAMFPERAQEVASGALNTVHAEGIIVIESTAYGADGDFYRRARLAEDMDQRVRAGVAHLSKLDYRFHFFGWFDDSKNNIDPQHVPISEEKAKYFQALEDDLDRALTRSQKAWYVKKEAEQGDKMLREFPSNAKEAFQGSTEGAYYGREMQRAATEGRICDLPFNPSAPVFTFWDIGRRDATAIWFMQQNNQWFDFIDYYEASGEQSAYFAKLLARYTIERGYVYGRHYMPHDIEVVEWGGTGDNASRKENMEKMGVKPIVMVPRIAIEQEGIDMVRRMLPRCRFDQVRCASPVQGDDQRGGLDALRNFRKDWNDQTKTFRDTPRKDWTNHGADAFRQFAQAYVPDRQRSETKKSHDEGNWKLA